MKDNNKPEPDTSSMDATVFARALAARRRIVEGVCEVCGAPIQGTSKKRYCGNACRLRARRMGLARPNRRTQDGREAQTTQEEAGDAKGL
jgi:hypothetical protein